MVGKRVRTMGELIETLKAAGVGQARMSCRVAAITSPGGAKIAFRGRVYVSAEVAGERIEYEERLAPDEAVFGVSETPVSAQYASELQRAQLELMRQLRAYREEYQVRAAAARTTVEQRLARAGIAVVDDIE